MGLYQWKGVESRLSAIYHNFWRVALTAIYFGTNLHQFRNMFFTQFISHFYFSHNVNLSPISSFHTIIALYSFPLMKTFSCPIREAECDEYMWIFEYSNIFVTNIYSDIHFYHFDRNMFGHLFVSNQVISNMNVCWLVIFLLCAVQRNTSICSFLAPTGAHIVMMVYHIYIYIQGHFFRFSLSSLMQLMLQVSL